MNGFSHSIERSLLEASLTFWISRNICHVLTPLRGSRIMLTVMLG